jgi:hypothetical protein
MFELEPRSEPLIEVCYKEEGKGESLIVSFLFLPSISQWSAYWALLPRTTAKSMEAVKPKTKGTNSGFDFI